jgi:hypothetical protein
MGAICKSNRSNALAQPVTFSTQWVSHLPILNEIGLQQFDRNHICHDLTTARPRRCSPASARPAPGKRVRCHARPATACAWHPPRGPARRPGRRSGLLLSAVSLHPFLTAGVKRNSVPLAPKLTCNASRARAKIPLTLLQSIITSGSVRNLFGFNGCAVWHRFRVTINKQKMRKVRPPGAFASTDRHRRLDCRLPMPRRSWGFRNHTFTTFTGRADSDRCRFAWAGRCAGRVKIWSIGLKPAAHRATNGW